MQTSVFKAHDNLNTHKKEYKDHLSKFNEVLNVIEQTDNDLRDLQRSHEGVALNSQMTSRMIGGLRDQTNEIEEAVNGLKNSPTAASTTLV